MSAPVDKTQKGNLRQEKKGKWIKKGCFVTEFGLKKGAVYSTLVVR